MYQIDSGPRDPERLVMNVVPGVSPVREALIARDALPEQNLRDWTDAPATRVRIGEEPESPALATTHQDGSTFTERAVAHAVAALENERSIAFAVDRSWPPQVVEVDAIDRVSGSATPLQVPILPSLLNPEGMAEVYRSACRMPAPKEERRDVDPGAA
jgi:hypothetical protein